VSEPAPLERRELAAWLRLLHTPGIGRLSARRLLAMFGSPEAVFDAPAAAWRNALDAAQSQALSHPPAGFDALLAATWDWLCHDERHAVLPLGDPRYPAALLSLPDPPLMLYASGLLDTLTQPALAVVGSRNPSAQGTENARQFAIDLGRAGLVVVSGLALGIDGAAHEGALDAPARTIAVMGTGVDITYPVRHRALAARIEAQGLLLSDFPLGTPPKAENFPQRNRLIAGLSLGTLVVEAALRSGSLITARLAAECGREVFAIPGSIHAPQSRGCHALIKQGAKLVECTQDILEELRLDKRDDSLRARRTSPSTAPDSAPTAPTPRQAPAAVTFDADDEEVDPVLRALGHGPANFDVLQVRTGCSAADLQVRLLSLELGGQIERLPGQVFQRLVRA
jgi:DNA processing protein